MSDETNLALWILWQELASVDTLDAEWAIFGSTTLAIRGIIDRDPGDIDVFVSRRVWGRLLARRKWRVETPNAGDPPILTLEALDGPPLHLFYDWRDDNVEIDVGYLIDTAEEIWVPGVGPYNVATIEEVERHKRAALAYGTLAVQKHKPDLEAIEAYKKERSGSLQAAS